MENNNPNKIDLDNESVLKEGFSYSSVSDKVTDIVLKRPVEKGWLISLGISLSFLGLLMVSVTWLFIRGIGIWGNNNPVGWAFDIINFVWWVGIAHAGTFISEIGRAHV